MKCPCCEVVDLLMSERLGIEIDYCPKCRGVWLDRGELDKFIEKSERGTLERGGGERRPQVQVDRYSQEQSSRNEGHRYERDESYRRDDDDEYRYSHPGKKKESLLSRLFDFD
jgi:uncharacterized protein